MGAEMPRLPNRAWASVLASVVLLAAPGAGLAQPPRPAAPPAAAPPAAAPQAAMPRVIYRLELIRTGPLPPDVLAKLGPLNTMDEVEKLLKAGDFEFAWRRADLDSATANPEFLKALRSLPPKEMFVIPQANGALIGVIVGQRAP